MAVGRMRGRASSKPRFGQSSKVPYHIAFYPCPSVIVRVIYRNVGKVNSGFGIRISFGLRISAFGFYLCPSVFICG